MPVVLMYQRLPVPTAATRGRLLALANPLARSARLAHTEAPAHARELVKSERRLSLLSGMVRWPSRSCREVTQQDVAAIVLRHVFLSVRRRFAQITRPSV